LKVNQSFIDDFEYLSHHYAWNSEDVEGMKAAIRENEGDGRRYITALAAAHRAGYSQSAGNGFVRLQVWCADRGLPDPFTAGFDPAALDAAQQQRTS
jgi:hypothetical protein